MRHAKKKTFALIFRERRTQNYARLRHEQQKRLDPCKQSRMFCNDAVGIFFLKSSRRKNYYDVKTSARTTEHGITSTRAVVSLPPEVFAKAHGYAAKVLDLLSE